MLYLRDFLAELRKDESLETDLFQNPLQTTAQQHMPEGDVFIYGSCQRGGHTQPKQECVQRVMQPDLFNSHSRAQSDTPGNYPVQSKCLYYDPLMTPVTPVVATVQDASMTFLGAERKTLHTLLLHDGAEPTMSAPHGTMRYILSQRNTSGL